MIKTLFIILLCGILSACQPVDIQDVDIAAPAPKRTVLKVGTLYGPQIYLNSEQGESGFDFEMAQRFADYLAVPLEMIPYTNRKQLFAALKENKIDIIAAGIAKTPNRSQQFKLGPTLYKVNQVLVYKEGTPEPKDISTLSGEITVMANSSSVNTLTKLQKDYPELMWNQVNDKDNEELFALIANGELNYTISDSNSLLINQRFLPELRAGMILEEKVEVVWLLPPNNSDRLMSKLLAFWHKERRAGTLEHLNEKYFGHVKRFDYVDTRAFIRAIDNILPEYRSFFEEYSGELDWRKLAAASYQESHWNPSARSPTGVRGMMMLTQPTAAYVGVDDRLDAEQSIRGGAFYLKDMMERLPDTISEAQRIWFALASYNIGLGHVEDARRLTESMGMDPSAWRDVKKVLPLLQQSKYYKQTRYGYARGSEAVHYVDSIRRYYDTLVWIDNQTKTMEIIEEKEQVEVIAEEVPAKSHVSAQ
ncbi:membrane-bound lytic murein transglycosylase MltF [Shewanella frigidimarina]|jgi:membrane-bound lytic murein transglycosylase F|uniref:Membrane-bound lytic murein transglycosylase F n=1 Tax=Shewanella frigidimarina (strain NCIMB 400) TaxID=318167 RepID=MLTF_SHEFN|nr:MULTISPECIES: membrane-bound lytic murein transglycosylase MltF [Shewanella]Q085S2.1 RecName: Full=Membrane-bound lytic murein transglycosylase F; AltName: Full=Murein lyase F; Flags: Precursor [Shewanella frigidimarina NCIMB 400]ABI70993.1 Lytic transglycosylase, catalytic [Shewanella frigidimarina NCIMB 400]PKH99563.1 lytic transglycosylase F [Shewanella sp. 11B5]RPA30812.1 membrane-bound lytic murein transglycosylase MltF [Shewanella frigidimarina]RPA62879.1 membrane-bound lytic murein t|tara:strand:- start:210 stop:1640 length:1431 start_codon:yes stop_codon:yes gene_type:complete